MIYSCFDSQELAEKYRDRAAERRDGGEVVPGAAAADDTTSAAYRSVTAAELGLEPP